MKKNRFGVVILVFLLLFLALVARLAQVTLVPDSRLHASGPGDAERGRILDRNGGELALSSYFYSLYARPKIISPEKREIFARELATTGVFSDSEIALLAQDKPFIWIKRRLPPSQAARLNPLFDAWKTGKRITRDEFGLSKEKGRIYPEIQTAAAVGVTGIDEQGLSGIEYAFNRELASGANVKTTLDPVLSAIALDEVRRSVVENRAEAGSAVILEAKTGEILAMVSWPSFDPNDFAAISPELLRPAVVGSVFEPGSVMKQFSAAYALDSGLATPGYPVYNCTGFARIEDHQVECVNPHGRVDLARILQKSCNVGMLQVADGFTRDGIYEFLRGAGFGSAPAVPLPGMERGILRPVEEWSVYSKFMVSIGQEIGVTALQLACASTVVANDGVYLSPVLVRSVGDVPAAVAVGKRLMKTETAKTLRRLMENVVSEDGTALLARVEGIAIAGKTGTGQVARPGGKGYYEDLYNAVFLGYIPADSPRFTITITIHQPKVGKHQGGEVAAPVFSAIVRRILATTSWLGKAGE